MSPVRVAHVEAVDVDGWSRNSGSACISTCQVRPNWLKSFTYRPPRKVCSVLYASVDRDAQGLQLVGVHVDAVCGTDWRGRC